MTEQEAEAKLGQLFRIWPLPYVTDYSNNEYFDFRGLVDKYDEIELHAREESTGVSSALNFLHWAPALALTLT